MYACVCVPYVVAALRIISEPSDTWAADPFSAEFTFSVQVYGNLAIKWYRNNSEPVPEKSNQTLIPLCNQTIITLTIPKVTSEDAGMYFCEVWANRMAVRSHAANLFCTSKICTFLAYRIRKNIGELNI